MNIVCPRRLRASHSCIAAIVMSLAVAGQAHATSIIQGSGVNADLSGGTQRDSYWNIVALPATNSIGSPTTPYAAYIVPNVPGVWYGGNSGTNGTQGGYSADGNTYYWIGTSGDNFFPTIADGNYNWIAAQTFNVQTTGVYEFNFYASGDNGIRFFIDGSIDTSNPQQPVITGGTQIGGYANNFGVITQYTGLASLSAGSHTAYMVLYDFGGNTGALIGQSVFEPSSVPEIDPAGLGSVAALLTGAVGLIERRRLKAKAA